MNPSPDRPAYFATTGPPAAMYTGTGMLGLVVHRRVDRPVVLALEAHPVLGPQLPHQPHRLAQPREPLLEVRPLRAGHRGLVQRLAGAERRARCGPGTGTPSSRTPARSPPGCTGTSASARSYRARPARCAPPPPPSTPARTARAHPCAATAGSGRTPTRCPARPARPAPRTPPAPAARTAPPTPCSRSAEVARTPSSPQPARRAAPAPCYTAGPRTATPGQPSGAHPLVPRVVQRTPDDLGVHPLAVDLHLDRAADAAADRQQRVGDRAGDGVAVAAGRDEPSTSTGSPPRTGSPPSATAAGRRPPGNAAAAPGRGRGHPPAPPLGVPVAGAPPTPGPPRPAWSHG